MSSEKAKSDQKAERLAQALRANLRRRKAQGRERAVDETGSDTVATATQTNLENKQQPE
tara:strand:- start:247 stop:423 length:177 start_codon:yes stop_codon:yes gene_type:complete